VSTNLLRARVMQEILGIYSHMDEGRKRQLIAEQRGMSTLAIQQRDERLGAAMIAHAMMNDNAAVELVAREHSDPVRVAAAVARAAYGVLAMTSPRPNQSNCSSSNSLTGTRSGSRKTAQRTDRTQSARLVPRRAGALSCRARVWTQTTNGGPRRGARPSVCRKVVLGTGVHIFKTEHLTSAA
jgi:hypothetical protein